jgi:hypothetical protein
LIARGVGGEIFSHRESGELSAFEKGEPTNSFEGPRLSPYGESDGL